VTGWALPIVSKGVEEPVNPDPKTVTAVPTGPLLGLKLLIAGRTSKSLLLVRVVVPVLIVTAVGFDAPDART